MIFFLTMNYIGKTITGVRPKWKVLHMYKKNLKTFSQRATAERKTTEFFSKSSTFVSPVYYNCWQRTPNRLMLRKDKHILLDKTTV